MDALALSNIQQDLKNLLINHILQAEEEDDIGVSFLAPDKDFIASLGASPMVNCYLIGVDEDKKRRQSEPPRSQLNKEKTQRIRQYEPRFVDISYMLTVWSRDKTNGAEIEHLMLGYLLSGLGASDFFPGVELDSPRYEAALYGVRMTLFGSEYADKVSGQVWQAMGATPKPCIMLSLSVPIDVRNERTLPIVTEIERATSNTAPNPEGT
ncbi:DUF4255 domain-containing protein [Marinomonas balearica]|uniref:Uncharacterized protein DUF4255 n=1 Tax=Marinomonas balearica TaxID=491947 RepID=A0A4R6M947_9GAMM|nr:DUF4255 domain-containing protein [Marinomonas balearica]TDO96679.1 uncharacterized protein DUF4255 [Marinomonas balearica]